MESGPAIEALGIPRVEGHTRVVRHPLERRGRCAIGEQGRREPEHVRVRVRAVVAIERIRAAVRQGHIGARCVPRQQEHPRRRGASQVRHGPGEPGTPGVELENGDVVGQADQAPEPVGVLVETEFERRAAHQHEGVELARQPTGGGQRLVSELRDQVGRSERLGVPSLGDDAQEGGHHRTVDGSTRLSAVRDLRPVGPGLEPDLQADTCPNRTQCKLQRRHAVLLRIHSVRSTRNIGFRERCVEMLLLNGRVGRCRSYNRTAQPMP